MTYRGLFDLVVRVIVISAALFLLWEWKLYKAYAMVFRSVVGPVYSLLGVPLASMHDAIGIVSARFYNVLPFVSLMIATSGVHWKSRVAMLISGVSIILVWHLTMPLLAKLITTRYGLGATAYQAFSPVFLFSDALPLILWIAFSSPSWVDVVRNRRVV